MKLVKIGLINDHLYAVELNSHKIIGPNLDSRYFCSFDLTFFNVNFLCVVLTLSSFSASLILMQA